eukprot:GGOE01061383.1.p1 GENE.GGOE01061383.1~~GGOE01061383.1.p1  ORF type:complete len:283 (+),score=70.34 GGOE01061383.1:47-850(+)
MAELANLKNFFQWVKSVMIKEFASTCEAVLDLCCGNASEVLVWQSCSAAVYIGADANINCLLQARRTIPPTNQLKCSFVEADCFSMELEGKLVEVNSPMDFNVVTCFFSIHLACSQEEKVRGFLHNVVAHLPVGGLFMGTVIDSNLVVKRLRASRDMGFGNAAYHITFSDRQDKAFPKSQPAVGHQFQLRIHDSSWDEFLVVWPYFLRLAEGYGLRLKWQKNVHELYCIYSKQHEDQWRRQGIREIAEADWDVAYLYKAFVFEKVER